MSNSALDFAKVTSIEVAAGSPEAHQTLDNLKHTNFARVDNVAAVGGNVAAAQSTLQALDALKSIGAKVGGALDQSNSFVGKLASQGVGVDQNNGIGGRC